MPSTSLLHRFPWLSSRADGPRIVGLCLVLAGYGLAAIDAARPWRTPRNTVHRLALALRAGDVQTLRTTPQLGAANFADELVTMLGEQEYRRVLGLYRQARARGGEAYERLRNEVILRGNGAFALLPPAQQQAIARRSHDEWVWQHGNAGDPSVSAIDLAPAEPSAPLLERLGNARLGAEERALLRDLPTTHPSVAADPTLAQLAQRRDYLGRAAFAALREAHRSSGERALRALGSAAAQEINARSHTLEVVTRGIEALDAADRGRVGAHGPAAFLETAAAEQLRHELGRGALTPEERAALGDRTEADFAASRDVFVQAQGLRLAVSALQLRFAGTSYDLASLRVRGATPRDLLQRREADAALAWSGTGATTLAPVRVQLRWSRAEREWRVEALQWSAPGGASSAAPAEASEASERDEGDEAR